MEIPKSTIFGDMLIRYVPVYGNNSTLQGEIVISKEEFLACYNAWVRGEENGK